MRDFRFIIISILVISFSQYSAAQENEQDSLIQLSGVVMDGTNQDLIPVSFASVFITKDHRGTAADYHGFFSIVASKGDTVSFSAIGYKTVDFVVPDSLTENRYSIVQLLTTDTFNLPETVVFPWPSRENFKLEFLAMDVTSELQEKAIENLAEKALKKMRNEVIRDGNENADYYLRQQAQSYYSFGQTPPMNIFNAFAWKKFFDAWKRGDFKKKRGK